MRRGIERQIAVADGRIAASRLAANQRPHARAEFVEIERLDEVIVCAGVEALHAVGHRIARGDDQHRQRVAARTQRAQHVETVALGQAEVEQHEIVGLARRRAERRFAVFHPVDREAFAAQCLRTPSAIIRSSSTSKMRMVTFLNIR